MKKFLGIFLAAILCIMMAVAVNAADVYVNDGGTGDGTTAEASLGDMTAAIEAIAAEGGTVHIVDTYTCADQFVEPEHAGNIVITGGKYVFTNGSFNRWYLSGAGSTTFENITFEYGAGSTSLFICQFNEIVIGEGVVFPDKFMSGEKEVAGRCYVVGGYQYNKNHNDKEYANLDEMIADLGWATDKDSKITVKSGKLWCVVGFCRGAASADCVFTGTSNITIEGDTIIDSAVYGGHVNGLASAGATSINISGGQIADVRMSSDANYVSPLTGDANVNISGGNIASLSMNNVLGKVNVETSGGIITMATKSVDESLTVTDGTATLTATGDSRVSKMLADAFDTFVGEIYVPAIPSITVPTETEEVVEDTADAANVTSAEGGLNPVVIIAIVIAVIVVVAIVVVIIKKKK